MAFSHTNSRGQEYFLHMKDVTLKGGRVQRIYFFAREVKPEGGLDAVPENMQIVENERTGLPILKKKA